MALHKNQRTLLRGIPGPILAVIAILWITAAVGLVESGGDWVDYSGREDRDMIVGGLLIVLMFADVVNAVLGFAIQMHWRWARSYAIMLSLVRAGAAAIAVFTGDMSAAVLIAVYLVIVVLMILPSSAAWFER